ncbi:MAG: hypothetical protein ACXWPM_11410, partial [Bdellovibrionota bacterium]
MAAKTKRPAGLWMMLYGLAFLLVVSAVSRSADSGSDGDSGFYFYWAGTTPWSELVSDMVARPAKPEYIFGRFRPYSRLSFKALYEAGLSPHAVAVENWIVV